MNIPPAIAALPGRQAFLRDRLVAWAEINSGSGSIDGLNRMSERLRPALLELTADVAAAPVDGEGRHLWRARRRPDAPRQVLLSGHYDTVYGPEHAFQRCATRADGFLNGPGVADMKGGLVVLLAALEAFEATPAARQVGWEILLTPDEETGSVASRPFIEEAAQRRQLGLVFESARDNGDLVLGRKGVGICTVVCHGRASHAGTSPEKGRNAIAALSEFLVAAHRIPSAVPGVQLNIGRVRGGDALNVVPDRAEAGLDLRVGSAAQIARLKAAVDQIARPINEREGYRLEATWEFPRLPLEVSDASRAWFDAYREGALTLGLPPFGWREAGGGSDANLLSAAGLTCLDGLGPVGGAYHSAEEWMDPASLVSRAQATALLLHRWAAGEISISAGSGRAPPSERPAPSPPA